MAARCYDENDNEDSGLVACWDSTDGEAVPCCSAEAGDSCASNGLCVSSTDGVATPYFIGGCTDSDWTNGSISGCPATNCISTGGNGVKPCGDSLYCCYGFTGCDCDNSTQVFTLDPVRIVTSLALTASETKTATTSKATSTTATATATASSSLSSSSSINQATATPSSSSGTSSNVNIGLGVGLGVGIPLSLAVIGSLWLLYRKYGQKRTPSLDTADTKSTGAGVGWPSYDYPAIAVNAELDTGNQPKTELPDNREVVLQSRSIIPSELAGDTSERSR